MDKTTGGRHCRRAFMIMMASAIALAAIGSVLMMANDGIDATGEMSGTCGDDLTWTIDSDGNLVIEGTGPMDEFEIGTEKWGGNTVITVTIGDSVTSVGGNAFYDCPHLKSATIGDSVLSIGDGAFFECWSLESVTLGKSVESIGYCSFWYCGFKSIDLPGSLKSIGETAFIMCNSLESVTVPDSVTSMGERPFDRCASLKSITVGSGNPAFSSSDGVLFDKEKTRLIQYPAGKEDRSYSIPDSVRTVASDAFGQNEKLEEVTIPGSVTDIEEQAFAYCTSLKSVTIPGSVTTIGDAAFSGCSALSSAIIPDSVTKIPGAMFLGCSSLKSVTIPGTVTEIGSGAFTYCTALESVVIPDSVTTIGEYAFSTCNSLLKIGIGSGVTTMKYAFRNHVFYDSDGTTALGNDASDYAGSCFIGTSMDRMIRSDWPSVTVTFDANGGQCSVESVKTENGRIASVPVPAREGCSFGGWSSSASGGAGVDGSTLFLEDATVYALWTEPSGPGQDKSIGNAYYAGIAVVIALLIAGAAFYKKLR